MWQADVDDLPLPPHLRLCLVGYLDGCFYTRGQIQVWVEHCSSIIWISRGNLGHPAPRTRSYLELEHLLLCHIADLPWCHPAGDSGGSWHQLLYITPLSLGNAEDQLTVKIVWKQNKIVPRNPKHPAEIRISSEILLLILIQHLKNGMTSNFPFTIFTHSQFRDVCVSEDRSFWCLAQMLYGLHFGSTYRTSLSSTFTSKYPTVVVRDAVPYLKQN